FGAACEDGDRVADAEGESRAANRLRRTRYEKFHFVADVVTFWQSRSRWKRSDGGTNPHQGGRHNESSLEEIARAGRRACGSRLAHGHDCLAGAGGDAEAASVPAPAGQRARPRARRVGRSGG